MVSYNISLFSWLARKDKFVLLNGPSIADLETELPRLKGNRPVLIGVNHIFNIENKILKPNGLTFDIWVLFSHDEVERYSEEIFEFLSRPTSIAILTTSYAMARIRDILEFRGAPNQHKVVSCDSIVETAQRMTSLNYTNPFNYESQISVNSLGLTLMTLAVVPPEDGTAIYLFGCDGADRREVSTVYYDQSNMDLGPRVVAERSIYQDMIAFEAYWTVLCRSFLEKRRLPRPRVLNANPGSYYESFPKIRIADIALGGSDEPFIPAPVGGAAFDISESLQTQIRLARATLMHTLARSENKLVDMLKAGGMTAHPEHERLERHPSELQEQLSTALAAHSVMTRRFRELEEDLAALTKELVETRLLLTERTEALDQTAKELIERTDELVENRRLLVERTELLETRTNELNELKSKQQERRAL